MRKLYALLVGLFIGLAGIHANPRPVSPDVANFTFTIDVPNSNVDFVNTSVLGNEPGPRRAYWSFGDGVTVQTPPLAGTQHHYAAPGTYNVCLRIYRYLNSVGDSVLSAQVCKTLIIEATCSADFERLPNTSASPLHAVFNALPWHSQNNRPVRVCWTFGDGGDTCIQYANTNPGPYVVTHTYPGPGTYEVCVKILYQGGCEARKCDHTLIGAPDSCHADFERLPISTSTNPLSVTYKALPWHNNNKKPSRICWTFGDGRDTCIPYLNIYHGQYNITHTYNHPGLYEVCVKITYFGGCESRKCKTLQIGRPDSCGADFERIQSSAANPLQAYFRALPQHNNNRKPSKICWQFGDNKDTCINYPENYTGQYVVSHRYDHPGQYEVCVKIFYYGGCESRKCKLIAIARPDSCAADFERIQANTSAPLLNYFRALPQHNNNRKPARICWQFGDNKDTCINYPENYTGQYVVSHRYDHPGQYEVCVKILYYGGCEARKCKLIQVGQPDSCHADFERIPGSTANPLQVYYRALPWHNNNRKPARICWQFGDGSDTCINYPENYTGQYVVSHHYDHRGQYEVCVKITYYGGCESRKCENVQVGEPDHCTADFEKIPSPTAVPLLSYFRALPWNDNNRKPARICWTFGDGEDTCVNYPENYTGQYVISHHYDHPGQYEVCVKIIYYGGCDARKCKTIVILPLPGTCAAHLFEITPSVTSLTRNFIAIPSSDPNRRPVRICWRFGDGQDTCIMINATPNPLPNFIIQHTYPGPGVYHACVRIFFEGGCIAEDCREVTIRSNSNICGGYMTDSLTGPRTFKFKGFSINAPADEVLSYRWTFGDGIVVLGREVTHTYSQGGNYEVCLTIITRLGCQTKICKTLHVPGSNNEPVLHLSPNPVINILHVDFFSTHTEQVSVKILDATGVVIRNATRNVTVGPNNWNVDLGTLTPGIYSFVVQSPNQLASAIFIKQ